MDALHEIYPEKWIELKDRLMKEWPRSFIVINWIETRMRWTNQHPNENPFLICCPDGIVEDGLVTFGKTGNRVFYLTVFTFHNDLTKLSNALLKTKHIDWNENIVCGVPTGTEQWFKGILEDLGYTVQHDTPTDYFRLPKETPLSFKIICPDDIYIDLLKQEDIPKINSLWQHSFDGSDHLLLECIKLNYGYGVYSKETKELLSWVIKYEYSDVAILQTDPHHRRKGYAKLVVTAICKKIAEEGEDVLTFIVPGNTASEKLFKGLGFEYAGSYNWLEYDKK